MTVSEALQIKDRQKNEAESAAEARTDALYAEFPELKRLDEALAAFGPRLVTAAIGGRTEELREMERDNLALQENRRVFLVRNGLAPDEDAPVYRCPRCRDSGYVGLTLCDCVRKLMAMDAYRSAGLGKGLEDKTFASFSMKYYSGEDREKMERVLDFCRRYAREFGEDSPSLLFIGKTGLGKTHLSAAIARGVAEKGFRVYYESAQRMFDTYEASRFGRDPGAVSGTELYENCDLLIIDDLGTECLTPYTSSTFFNLLNTRIIHHRPILISTNLNRVSLEKNYGERVLSRLFGEFRVLLFSGTDVRMQKLGDRLA